MNSQADKIVGSSSDYALARLYSGRLSDEEVKAIRQKAAMDPQFREDYLGSLEFLADLERLSDDPDVRVVANQHGSSWSKGRLNAQRALSMTAGILIAFCVGLFGYLNLSEKELSRSDMQRYVTRIGEQKEIQLPDGSVVNMNTATQLLVDYTEGQRRIILDRGEAYFDVAPNPEKTFTVDLGVKTVTVLGTEFNIRKSPGHYQLAVVEGEVAVHFPGDDVSPSASLIENPISQNSQSKQYRVKGGWVAEFDIANNEMEAYQSASQNEYGGWRNGLIRFYKEPLYKVIQELNRYSGKKILIEDKEIMDLGVYVAVDIKDLGAALKALEQILPIKVISHFDRIVIVGSEG
ncbi:FecR domain-containing protein [Porticoccaceae bacterium LTM1]|nr:FecR domain-containing protein [Porticoccaceae bacterium LTM1]